MNSRAHRAWKDAWFSFRSLTWSTLGDPGWCWFSMALQRYRQEEEKFSTRFKRSLTISPGGNPGETGTNSTNRSCLPPRTCVGGASLPLFRRSCRPPRPSPKDSGHRLSTCGPPTIHDSLSEGQPFWSPSLGGGRPGRFRAIRSGCYWAGSLLIR